MSYFSLPTRIFDQIKRPSLAYFILLLPIPKYYPQPSPNLTKTSIVSFDIFLPCTCISLLQIAQLHALNSRHMYLI